MSKATTKSKRNQVHVIAERCKGCGFCIEFCPQHVLYQSTEANSEGYHPAYLKESDKCTGCGICSMICPDFAIYVASDDEPEKQGK